jgi:2-dehydro-3-deoxygluconokinase
MSDRGYSAAAQICAEEFDWQALFGQHESGRTGARWFHTGGIFAALSESTAATALTAVRAHRLMVSYDLNYRASLWQSHPDPGAAQQTNRAIAQECDLLIGDEFSLSACLGFDASQFTHRSSSLDAAPAITAAHHALARYPQLKAVAFTLRGATSASRNDWAGALVTRTGIYQSRPIEPKNGS